MNINEIIRNRAEEKLSKEITEFLAKLKENKFFGVIADHQVVVADCNKSIGQQLWPYNWKNTTLGQKIFNFYIEQYETEEAKAFMQKVEAMDKPQNTSKKPAKTEEDDE